MAYLLDTDICIYMINRKPGYEGILGRMDGLRYGDILLSAITLAELEYGIAKSQHQVKNRGRLERFLARFEVRGFDESAAVAYGFLRAKLEADGTPIRPLDTLLAGHALSLGAIMVTNNVREFSRVPGLGLENWLEVSLA